MPRDPLAYLPLRLHCSLCLARGGRSHQWARYDLRAQYVLDSRGPAAGRPGGERQQALLRHDPGAHSLALLRPEPAGLK